MSVRDRREHHPYAGSRIKHYSDYRVHGQLLGHTWYSTRNDLWSGRALGDKRLVGAHPTLEAAREAVAKRHCAIAAEAIGRNLTGKELRDGQ